MSEKTTRKPSTLADFGPVAGASVSIGQFCRRRLAGIAVASAALVLLTCSPAPAFQVFLDYNTDGNLWTIESEVVGLEIAPITIIVEFGPEDSTTTYVPVQLDWDCHPGELDLAVPHGEVEWPSPFEVLPPFTDGGMITCLGLDCGCQAFRWIEALLPAPITSGRYELATLDFSVEPDYATVEFRALVNFSPVRTMTFYRSTSAEEPTIPINWGRLRAGFR